MTSVDWSKYGIGETKQSSVDWDKYLSPSPPQPQNQFIGAYQTREEMEKIHDRASRVQKSRQLPLIGGVLGGLDVVGEKIEPAVSVARSFYTPGAGLGNVASAYTATGAALNRVAPGLGNTLGGRVAQEAIKEGVVSAPVTAGNVLMQGETDLKEVAKQGAIGGALGAGVGASLPLIGAGVRNLISKYRKPSPTTLALPEGRRDQRINSAIQRSVNEPGTTPIVNEYTFGLPEASPSLRSRAKNVSEARKDLRQIESGIKDLESKYTQAINDEYKYLKSSLEGRSGVSQGGVIRDRSGDVVGRYGRTSENPQWYQEFYSQNNRAPSNRELYELARQRVDQGFTEGATPVPSWRSQNQYDETLEALTSVRNQISESLRELDPAINVSDRPIVDSVLKSTSPRNPRPQQIPEPLPIQAREELRPHASLKDDAIEILGELFPPGQVGFAQSMPQSPYRAAKNDTKSQLVTKLDREPFSASKKANELYINFVDDIHRMNQFDRFVERKLGTLNPSNRPYDLAMAARGSDIISNQILTEGLVDSTGNVVGKSMKEVLSPIPKNSFVDFEDYLVNRHAITRHARGEKVYDDALNWTPEKGQQKIADLERRYPMFRQVAEDYYEFNNKMVENWLVGTGLLNRSEAARWIAENPTYVPMKRQFSELEKGNVSRGSKKGFADQKAPVKEYSKTGSQRKIFSPIESSIENVDAFVKSAKRNQAMQAMVRNIRKNPEDFKEWAEIVTPQGKLDDLKDIDLYSSTGLDDLMNRLNDDFDKVLKKDRLDRDNIVRVMMDGEQVHLKINDKQLLDAVLALGPEGQNWLLDSLGQVTRVFKVLTTGANPFFGLFRNLPRDVSQAFIARRNSNLREFGKDLVESFVSTLGNRQLYQSYKNIGGGHASAVAADRNLLAQSKRAILPQNRIKSSVPTVFGAIENFMNALEAVPRLGEFKRAGMGNVDQRLKGLLDAQDITVNFKKKGRLARQIDKAFPYFNAAMQGLDKLGRMYKDDPVKALGRTFMGITVPTIALYAMNYDNPDYQKVSKHVRDNYFLIPKGDGTFYRVAKHRELGIPFSAAVERVLDTWLKDDPEAFRNFSNSVRIAFAPPGLSGALESGSITDRLTGSIQDTIMGPFVDLAKNETFTGAPIVPAHLERLSPEHQHDERTSEVSKAISRLTRRISDKTGIDITSSPKQLDHLIRSYTGVIGQYGLPATTQGTSTSEAIARQVVVDPVYSNETQNRFYELKEKLDRAKADFDATGEQSKDYDEDMRTVFNQVNSVMSDLRSVSREIENSDLSDDQKQKHMREIRRRINEVADRTNQLYRETR